MTLSRLTSARSKLTASYVAALVLALVAFGVLAVVVIDRDLHASLDARLRTTAQAALNFIDMTNGRIEIDQHDREQLFALLGSQTEIAILDGAATVFSTAGKPSPDLLGYARGSNGFTSLKHDGVGIRALVLPVTSGTARAGAVVVWANTEWIKDTDRQVALAFAVAVLLIAGVALYAGNALARRALEDAFARQRRFTTDASHELRAPLSVIRAETDLALRKPRDAATYQAALATIAAESETMEKLVSGLLTAARSQDGQSERTLVDLAALARRVCARLQPTADVKHVALSYEADEASKTLGDGDAFERAITAIIHNAIKYAPAWGSVKVSAATRRGRCELTIVDSGPGFSSEALVHGLNWFWRETWDSAGSGTGLGLAIANSIVRASRGRLTLSNAPEGGAHVQISLPAH